MDVPSLAAAATAMVAANTNMQLDIAMLKKSQEIEAQTVAMLSGAVSPNVNLPPNLGQNIDTTA